MTALLVLAGLSVIAAPARAAEPPEITAPDRVYPTENTTMHFSGTDAVTSESRTITISGLTDGTTVLLRTTTRMTALS
jgi:hypothetical protein